MSKYADRLMKHIEEHPEFIQPESRKNEMVDNFLKPGLQDLCVSRTSFSWGIPVDFDPGHVVYVWLDALTNYITFCGYDPDGNHDEHYKKFWPADVHLIGKDIIRFHTIYWPIFLMALERAAAQAGIGSSGGCIRSATAGCPSRSPATFSTRTIWFACLVWMPFATTFCTRCRSQNDGVLSYELICERINSDLANVLGNLVNRTIAMTKKYFGGIVPAPTAPEALDDELKAVALGLPAAVEKKMDTLHVADAIDEVFALLRRSNKYIDETMPWALAKDESKQARRHGAVQPARSDPLCRC